ncbi:MAG: deoxyribodipyrimidine photo-lyase [Gammaproteobacteria bacterium]|jgi:deoxyribodipyrimidine photo-lyase
MNRAIWWLRRDLRLHDNLALRAALERGEGVIPVFIWSPDEEGDWPPGGAQRWWLHQSLEKIGSALSERGSGLVLRRGESLAVLRGLLRETGAGAVYWNRLYEPRAVERDTAIKQALREQGLEVESFNGGLLFEPWSQSTQKGDPYRVFTPFWRSCLNGPGPAEPLPAPETVPAANSLPESLDLDDLGLMPGVNWHEGLAEAWTPGEAAGLAGLEKFLDERMDRYHERRDYPAVEGTSRLSPYLHLGELSPRTAWQAASARRARSGAEAGGEAFLRELGWREFAHHVLYHFPGTPAEPMDERFREFPWRDDPGGWLEAWQRGRTGVPIVDAGMRQLWQTGWMHNRVRMIVASYLVKNLRLDWRHGARWFWDTLVDADLASNTMGWQWSAGSGADAAPYFRIFNPVLQGEKFDPDGGYVRTFVPEIRSLPPRFVHKPWAMPDREKAKLGFEPGNPYPEPLVDLKTSREEALEAFKGLPKR